MKIKRLAGTLAVLRVLGSGIALASSVRCTTSEVKSLGRMETLCDDGTRAVSTFNKILNRWDTTITPPHLPPSGRCGPGEGHAPLTTHPRDRYHRRGAAEMEGSSYGPDQV